MLKRLLPVLALLVSTSALAEPVEYLLKVSPQDVQVIGTALGARPYVEVQALVAKLQAQISEQAKLKPEDKAQ